MPAKFDRGNPLILKMLGVIRYVLAFFLSPGKPVNLAVSASCCVMSPLQTCWQFLLMEEGVGQDLPHVCLALSDVSNEGLLWCVEKINYSQRVFG